MPDCKVDWVRIVDGPGVGKLYVQELFREETVEKFPDPVVNVPQADTVDRTVLVFVKAFVVYEYRSVPLAVAVVFS